MAIKIADYIMEQDISTASCADIELAQCFAEMEVMATLAECYAKQAVLMEYSAVDVSEFGIFQEQDAGEDAGETPEKKKESFISKAKGVWGGFMERVGKLLQKALDAFIDIVTRVNPDKLIKAVEKGPDDAVYPVKEKYAEALEAVFIATAVFESNINQQITDGTKYYEIITDLNQLMTDANNNDTVKNLGKTEMIEELNNIKELGVIPRAKKLLKDAGFNKKEWSSEDYGGSQELVRQIREVATHLHKMYVIVAKNYQQIQNAVIKSTQKSIKDVDKQYNKMERQAKKERKAELKAEKKAEKKAAKKSSTDDDDEE